MSDLLYPLSVYSGTGVVVTFVCTVSPSCTLQYTTYVFVHKELVSLPFTINTEPKQVVSIHWTGTGEETGGSAINFTKEGSMDNKLAFKKNFCFLH